MKEKPVFFDGWSKYPTNELRRQAVCFGVFVTLAEKSGLEISTVLMPLGMNKTQSRQVARGIVNGMSWQQYVKYTAKLIYANYRVK